MILASGPLRTFFPMPPIPPITSMASRFQHVRKMIIWSTLPTNVAQSQYTVNKEEQNMKHA